MTSRRTIDTRARLILWLLCHQLEYIGDIKNTVITCAVSHGFTPSNPRIHSSKLLHPFATSALYAQILQHLQYTDTNTNTILSQYPTNSKQTSSIPGPTQHTHRGLISPDTHIRRLPGPRRAQTLHQAKSQKPKPPPTQNSVVPASAETYCLFANIFRTPWLQNRVDKA